MREFDSKSKPKRNAFRNIFRKIETVSDAEGVIRSASILVLLYAGFKVILAVFIDVALLWDALLLVLVALPLLIFKNRFAAIAMLVLMCLVTLDTVVQAFAGRPSLAVLIVVLLLWVSVRAVKATFRLKRGDLAIESADTQSKPGVEV
ncbi:MAG: hypothetical protein IH808_04165 [Proteobacteria bacterium]|nr:hypothetical protein [Pseudomonadota bacterium]